VIVEVAIENVVHVANDALVALVILARAARPLARVLDVYLAGGMHESKEPTGDNGDRVLLVVDAREVDIRVDVVCESLVAHAREAVVVRLERRTCGQVQREVDRVDERDRGAEGVPDERDGAGAVLGHALLRSGEDVYSACAFLNPSCVSIELGTPGNRVELSFSSTAPSHRSRLTRLA